MKKQLYAMIGISLLSLSSCGSKSKSVTSFDFRYDIKDIKLKNKDRGEEAFDTATKLKKKFSENYSFRAKSITYYYDSSKPKEKPVPAVVYDYVYESTSFSVSMTQTHTLGDGQEMPKPDHQEYYCNGTVFYSRVKDGSWQKTTEAGAVKSRIEQFKPNIIILSAASAMILGGKTGAYYVFDQTGTTSQQDIRLVGKNNVLTYYYERMASNTFFSAYEFFYGEDNTVKIPADLPA